MTPSCLRDNVIEAKPVWIWAGGVRKPGSHSATERTSVAFVGLCTASLKRKAQQFNKQANQHKTVDLTGDFEDAGREKSINIMQSSHLIMQLFEIREQVLKVIKDFSHGRLAGECAAMSKRSKQQLKNLNRNTQLKASNHVRDVGPKWGCCFLFSVLSISARKRFPPEEWRPGLKACFNKRTDTSIFVSER